MAATDDVFEAIRAGDRERLRALLAANAARASGPGDGGVSPVMYALYHRRKDLVDALLAADPEISVFDAAALGDAEAVTRFLDAFPAFLRARAADGFTLLHLAAFFGRGEVLDLLLHRGAAVDAVADNPMRVTPLHSAAAAGEAAVVETLLRSGADPDARQEGGWTALHQAALRGDAAMVRALLSFGADPSIRADDGRTAADLAAAKRHFGIVPLLGPSPGPGDARTPR
jgi:ankyrin repeat protein